MQNFAPTKKGWIETKFSLLKVMIVVIVINAFSRKERMNNFSTFDGSITNFQQKQFHVFTTMSKHPWSSTNLRPKLH